MAQPQLNDEEALRIIQLHLEGNLEVRLEADFFGVSPETIRRIARRDTYRHLTVAQKPGRTTKKTQVTEAEVAAIDASLAILMDKLGKD
jgi:transposase